MRSATVCSARHKWSTDTVVMLFVHQHICHLWILRGDENSLVLFCAAYPSTLRTALCGGRGLLGKSGGDGASSGSQLHPHRLSQAQPS